MVEDPFKQWAQTEVDTNSLLFFMQEIVPDYFKKEINFTSILSYSIGLLTYRSETITQFSNIFTI